MFLHLKIVEAVDIPKMDIITKSDPYCIVSLSNSVNRQRTKTIDNTDHPVWNQEFHFPIKKQNDTTSSSVNICITVYDEDTFSKDDKISSIEIPINDYMIGRVYDEWYSLYPATKKKPGGRIHLIVHVAPKEVKPFQSMPTNMMNPNMMNPNMMNPYMMNPNMMNQGMMNPNMNYSYNPQSQLPHLNNMCIQQQPVPNQYVPQYIPQQPMMTPNSYVQQQQMQRMQQVQRSQQMPRMQTYQQTQYLPQQNQYSCNYSNLNNNMMYGAVPPPNPNIYSNVAPSQLPRISNQTNTF